MHDKDWFEKLDEFIFGYPDAGMIGCLFISAKDKDDKIFIYNMSGMFDEDGN